MTIVELRPQLLTDPSAKIAQDLLDTIPQTPFRAFLADGLVFNDPRVVESVRIARGRAVRILVLTNPLVCVDEQGSNSFFDLAKEAAVHLRHRNVFADHGSFTIARSQNGALINSANPSSTPDIGEWATYKMEGTEQHIVDDWGVIFDVEFENAALSKPPLLLRRSHWDILAETMRTRGLHFNMAGYNQPDHTHAIQLAAMANVPLLSP